ncbi:hypothetical protein [Rhodopirellula europaea]|uniref:hypothetical protein n=1 Tax=Rhodopirellula europaea TaxID=1263866 RepID=UPI003D2A1940
MLAIAFVGVFTALATPPLRRIFAWDNWLAAVGAFVSSIAIIVGIAVVINLRDRR